jgi:hypothetical protein
VTHVRSVIGWWLVVRGWLVVGGWWLVVLIVDCLVPC